jgi:hypothetical protein
MTSSERWSFELRSWRTERLAVVLRTDDEQRGGRSTLASWRTERLAVVLRTDDEQREEAVRLWLRGARSGWQWCYGRMMSSERRSFDSGFVAHGVAGSGVTGG